MAAYNTIGFAVVVCALTHYVVTKAPVFQHAYTTQMFKQTDNAWLYKQCKEPSFYSNMRQHTGVCELVRQTFAVSPIMAGVQACFPSPTYAPTSGWNKVFIGIALGMCIMMAPTVLLPMLQRRNAQHQIDKLHKSMNSYGV